MHCRTAWQWWAGDLLQYTASLPGGSWQWTSCNTPPHCQPVRTPLAIFESLGVCIYGPASRHGLISYSPIHLT